VPNDAMKWLLSNDGLGAVATDQVRAVEGRVSQENPELFIRCPHCEARRWLLVTWQAASTHLDGPLPQRL
jgi:hypothetical protein